MTLCHGTCLILILKSVTKIDTVYRTWQDWKPRSAEISKPGFPLKVSAHGFWLLLQSQEALHYRESWAAGEGRKARTLGSTPCRGGAGGITQQLRALVSLAKDLGSVLSIHIASLYITVCHSRSRGSSDLFSLLEHQAPKWSPGIHVGKTTMCIKINMFTGQLKAHRHAGGVDWWGKGLASKPEDLGMVVHDH